jgi:ABC-type phosphate transport system substrate-binding protein
MTKLVRIAGTAAAVLVSVVLISCGNDSGEGRNEPRDVLQIEGAGAPFPEPLYQKWIARYETRGGMIHISSRQIRA